MCAVIPEAQRAYEVVWLQLKFIASVLFMSVKIRYELSEEKNTKYSNFGIENQLKSVCIK